MRKKILLILLILNCIVLCSLLLFFYPQTTTKSHVVTRTNQGFSPKSLTIHPGDTIIFKNATQHAFWPASDPHPTHTFFSLFDPKHPLTTNQTWSFTFTKSGIWSFHDHLSPMMKGTIIVTQGGNTKNISLSSSTSLTACTKELNSIACWEHVLKQMLFTKGVAFTLSSAANETKTNQKFLNSCHDTMHTVGQTAFDLYKDKHIFEASPFASICGYGFYHGFMEKLFTSTTDKQSAKIYCDEVTKAQSSILADACYHGIGHGVVEYLISKYPSDLPKLIKASTALCEETVGSNEKEHCYSGVFMEISTILSNKTYDYSFDTSSPLSLCTALPKLQRIACYNQFYGILSVTTDGDLKKAIEQINTIPVPSERYTPLQNFLGVTFSEQTTSLDEILAICRTLEKNELNACIEGIAQAYVLKSESGEEYTKAISFCRSEVLASSEKHVCYQFVLRFAKDFLSSSSYLEFCNQLTREEKNLCLADKTH